MPCRRGLRIKVAGIAGSAALALTAGCTTASAGADHPPPSTQSGPATSPSDVPTTTAAPSPHPAEPGPVTIAFAGDVHFASFLADRLAHPRTALGPMRRILSSADLSIVNLETAVTERGAPQPKDYVFRAPPSAFTALKDAGVDVVTMANNHALDYGEGSVPDARAAAASAGMPVIGLGEDEQQAYRPWFVTVHGQRIAFLAATAVLDADLVSSWSAGPAHPGVATALDGDNARLIAAVRAAGQRADAVVVDLHYGSDLQTCPTDIQRALVEDLADAGADVVVGQHAHVLLGAGYEGSTYVDYGLGNFEFYVSAGAQGDTGVLLLTIDGGTATSPRWTPARISSGVPYRARGAAAEEALEHWQSLRDCTALQAAPER